MNRTELEKKVFDIENKNIATLEEAEEIIKMIKEESTESLLFFLKEYQEHLNFVSAVDHLEIKYQK